jgi:hypothetical protein
VEGVHPPGGIQPIDLASLPPLVVWAPEGILRAQWGKRCAVMLTLGPD